MCSKTGDLPVLIVKYLVVITEELGFVAVDNQAGPDAAKVSVRLQ